LKETIKAIKQDVRQQPQAESERLSVELEEIDVTPLGSPRK
jgi:hypothetical protein